MERSAVILVVDDEQDIAANFADILSDLGYRADQAHDGASAMQLVQQQRYDLLLLDYRMADIDGVTLFEQIRGHQPDVPAIMITAHPSATRLQHAVAAGVCRVLRKPVDVARLLDCVAEAL